MNAPHGMHVTHFAAGIARLTSQAIVNTALRNNERDLRYADSQISRLRGNDAAPEPALSWFLNYKSRLSREVFRLIAEKKQIGTDVTDYEKQIQRSAKITVYGRQIVFVFETDGGRISYTRYVHPELGTIRGIVDTNHFYPVTAN